MARPILIIILLTLLGCLAAEGNAFIDARTGKPLSAAKLAAKLKKYDVVFFGEWHDNAAVHAAQIELTRLLQAASPRLILSFEMFERDVQPALDAYLQGKTSEEEFLGAARPWPNYASDYRPLIEFARENGLHAIAANVPRRLAGMAARNGSAWQNGLSEEERTFAALEINTPAGRYKDNFLATMRDNGAHGDGGDEAFLENMYLAQCVKDDTMAESIVRYLELYPRHRIIHFNGDFHSREFLGTVERVLKRAPKLKVAVLSPWPEGEAWTATAAAVADWLVVVPQTQEQQGGEGSQP